MQKNSVLNESQNEETKGRITRIRSINHVSHHRNHNNNNNNNNTQNPTIKKAEPQEAQLNVIPAPPPPPSSLMSSAASSLSSGAIKDKKMYLMQIMKEKEVLKAALCALQVRIDTKDLFSNINSNNNDSHDNKNNSDDDDDDDDNNNTADEKNNQSSCKEENEVDFFSSSSSEIMSNNSINSFCSENSSKMSNFADSFDSEANLYIPTKPSFLSSEKKIDEQNNSNNYNNVRVEQQQKKSEYCGKNKRLLLRDFQDINNNSNSDNRNNSHYKRINHLKFDGKHSLKKYNNTIFDGYSVGYTQNLVGKKDTKNKKNSIYTCSQDDRGLDSGLEAGIGENGGECNRCVDVNKNIKSRNKNKNKNSFLPPLTPAPMCLIAKK